MRQQIVLVPRDTGCQGSVLGLARLALWPLASLEMSSAVFCMTSVVRRFFFVNVGMGSAEGWEVCQVEVDCLMLHIYFDYPLTQ